MARPCYAILLDGGFVTKRLFNKLGGRPATADDVVAECDRLRALPLVADYELLRIYWYDALPSAEQIQHRVSRGPYNLATTDRYRRAQSLYDQLILKPNFALRLGHVMLPPKPWKLKANAINQLLVTPRVLTDADFVLDVSQKGVDMRVGMDMARLALRDMVRTVVVVTSDSDFVPAFKFVRREGVKVILEPLGINATIELRRHADIVL
jgi:uncharacterized LabA/DUF88 family protein